MKKYSNYRFKTEQEMFNEFGPDWRKHLDWAQRMDYLLGLTLTTEELNYFVTHCSNDEKENMVYYTCSTSMAFPITFPFSDIEDYTTWWIMRETMTKISII